VKRKGVIARQARAYSVDMNPTSVSPTAAVDAAQDSTAFRLAARVGYVVLGLVHVVIGMIAVSIAAGAGGGEADQSGAMEQIARVPFGVVVLWVIAVGLAALGVWRVGEAVVERDPDAKRRWGRRAKEVGTAAAYFAIAGTALVYALGGSCDSSESTRSFTAGLPAIPAGVGLVVLLGLLVLGVGVAFVGRGARRDFEKQLSLPAGAVGGGIRALGVVGYVAKGVAVAVVGVLFVIAALTHDPEKAGGLDSALRSMAELPFGRVLLWLVGAGLVIYGVYCFARARYARL
jgi:hypothetical protein